MTGLVDADRPLHENFDCALLDLDGVVYRGADAVPHAAGVIGTIRGHGMGTVFVTNNASRTPEDIADHLTELGVPTGPEEVTTAAMATAAFIASHATAHTRVLVVGGTGLRQALTEQGLQLVDTAASRPTVVVQGFGPDLTWSDLAEASYAVADGAQYVATNLDLSLPTERGLAPGNGALVGAVSAATGVVPQSVGKPEPEIFTQAARRGGAGAPVIIGDRLDTDLTGARAAGIPGLHVFTGVDGPAQVLRAAASMRPSFLGHDLRALHTQHRAPRPQDGWWHCGNARARVDQGGLLLSRGGTQVRLGTDTTELQLDELRAAAAAAWTASDAAGVDSVLPPRFPQLRLVGADQDASSR